MLARRRRHLLRADRRPPQAQPRAGRLHLRPPLRPRAGARRVRRDRRRALGRRRARAAAARALPPADRGQPLARRARRRASSSSPCGCPRRRRRPSTCAPASGRRSRSRSSRSRPRARATTITLVAAGVANIPRALDPADPLAGLPGHPAERVEADGARDARRAGDRSRALRPTPAQRGVVTARMSAMWTSCRAGRAIALGLLPVLDLSDPGPELGRGARARAGSDRRPARRRRSPRGRR